VIRTPKRDSTPTRYRPQGPEMALVDGLNMVFKIILVEEPLPITVRTLLLDMVFLVC
jgi:hypothetical protein